MERLLERHDFEARFAARIPISPRELEACLHCFGAAVAEERTWQTREVRETLGELTLQRVVKEVRRVKQRSGLIRNRVRETAIRVSERGDADPREQIEILLSVRVVQANAVATNERDRLTPIRLQHVPRFQ